MLASQSLTGARAVARHSPFESPIPRSSFHLLHAILDFCSSPCAFVLGCYLLLMTCGLQYASSIPCQVCCLMLVGEMSSTRADYASSMIAGHFGPVVCSLLVPADKHYFLVSQEVSEQALEVVESGRTGLSNTYLCSYSTWYGERSSACLGISTSSAENRVSRAE